mmetsp:Transcript_2745/g.4461  ORF Transcript_2745/g.4461 Transcript_2745/m.4461 type:complete len:122 (+) Transcript_2745:414-779(+)
MTPFSRLGREEMRLRWQSSPVPSEQQLQLFTLSCSSQSDEFLIVSLYISESSVKEPGQPEMPPGVWNNLAFGTAAATPIATLSARFCSVKIWLPASSFLPPEWIAVPLAGCLLGKWFGGGL